MTLSTLKTKAIQVKSKITGQRYQWRYMHVNFLFLAYLSFVYTYDEFFQLPVA